MRSDDLTALDYLEVRLAASDWQVGSWLGELEESSPAPRRSERAGGTPAEAEATPARSAAQLAALYQSVESANQALSLLQDALGGGGLDRAERDRAAGELVRVTVGLLRSILQLDRCDAAEHRVRTVLADALTFGLAERLRAALDPLQPEIEACEARVAASQPAWDPAVFIDRVNRAQSLCDQATALPADQAEQARALRFECLQQRQEAIGQLQAGLETGAIEGDLAAQARRDLARLHEQVLATMLRLDLSASAGVELAQTLAQPDLLTPEDAEQLGAVESRLAAAKPQQGAAGGAGPEQVPTTVDWARIDDLARQNESLRESAVPPAEGEGTGASTEAPAGESEGTAAPAPEPEQSAETQTESRSERTERTHRSERGARSESSRSHRETESIPEVGEVPEPAPSPFGRIGTIPTQ